MHWAEAQQPGWVEQHVESWANVAGTVLGLPKAASALLSGALPASLRAAGCLACSCGQAQQLGGWPRGSRPRSGAVHSAPRCTSSAQLALTGCLPP